MMKSKVIIFPTDTVYGIGTSIYDKEGIKRIYEIKHRDPSKPLAVLCANLEQIDEIAYVSDVAKKLIKSFLPGPLTLILKAKPSIKEAMGYETIGVRIPNYPLAIDILLKEGPMATTSVNESGKPSLNNYSIIKEEYDDLVDGIVPPSSYPTSNLASTVVDLVGEIKVLRQGTISLPEILNAIKSE